jgi:excisionase family DNA binding protein
MELLTVEQAAEFLGTRPRFIRRLIEQNRIGYTKLGRFIRLQPADLEAFVAAGRVEPQRHGPHTPRTTESGRDDH